MIADKDTFMKERSIDSLSPILCLDILHEIKLNILFKYLY